MTFEDPATVDDELDDVRVPRVPRVEIFSSASIGCCDAADGLRRLLLARSANGDELSSHASESGGRLRFELGGWCGFPSTEGAEAAPYGEGRPLRLADDSAPVGVSTPKGEEEDDVFVGDSERLKPYRLSGIGCGGPPDEL